MTLRTVFWNWSRPRDSIRCKWIKLCLGCKTTAALQAGGEHLCNVQMNSCLHCWHVMSWPWPSTASRGTPYGRAEGEGGEGHYLLAERMKLPAALFGYTKKLMTSFLAGHSSPGGQAISKLAQVCVVSENMVHGRGQSLALSWQLLKIRFHWHTHSTHLCWPPPSLFWWHCKTLYSSVGARHLTPRPRHKTFMRTELNNWFNSIFI